MTPSFVQILKTRTTLNFTGEETTVHNEVPQVSPNITGSLSRRGQNYEVHNILQNLLLGAQEAHPTKAKGHFCNFLSHKKSKVLN